MLLSEKTKIPLGIAAGVLLTLVPAIWQGAKAQARVDAAEDRIGKLELRAGAADAGMAQVRQDVAVIRERIEFQTQVLQELRADLKARK